jgi:hypothetical protein
MKPFKITPVRAVNRINDSDRSHKKVKKNRSSTHESPDNNHTQLNTTEEYSDEEGVKAISKKQRLLKKKLNDQ